MGAKRRAPATGYSPSDRFVLKVDADSTDEELDAMAEGIAEWVKAHGGTFRSEDTCEGEVGRSKVFDEDSPAAGSEVPTGRFVLDVGDDPSQDDALIDGIIAWIEERCPDFFLPED